MRDNWKLSQRGNPYVLVDGRCVTWFRRRDGWSWSITKDGDEPLWSSRLHASERDARIDAFDVLLTFYEGPNREEG
jgi:hypothetical protein